MPTINESITTIVDAKNLLHQHPRPFDYLHHEWNAREFGEEKRSRECVAAQEAAIVTAKGLTLVALPGLYDKNFYKDIPKVDTPFNRKTMHTATLYGDPTLSELTERIYLRGDEKEVFDFASDYVDKNRDELEKILGPIDLVRLTPDQAIYLAGRVVKTSINYDYLVIDDPEARERIADPEEKLDVMELFEHNRARYDSIIKERERVLDGMTTGQRLKFGRGICRHYAEDTAKVFYALKLFQTNPKDTGMNNVDVFFYGSDGLAKDYMSDDDHAYNVVMVRIPTPDGKTEAVLSISDTTWAKTRNGENDFDQTIRRLSSLVGFIKVNGELLGMESPEEQALEAAKAILSRIPEIPLDTYFEDYVALRRFVFLSEKQRHGCNAYDLFNSEIVNDAAKDQRAQVIDRLIHTPIISRTRPFYIGGWFYHQLLTTYLSPSEDGISGFEEFARASICDTLITDTTMYCNYLNPKELDDLLQIPEYRNSAYLAIKAVLESGIKPEDPKTFKRIVDALRKRQSKNTLRIERDLVDRYKENQ